MKKMVNFQSIQKLQPICNCTKLCSYFKLIVILYDQDPLYYDFLPNLWCKFQQHFTLIWNSNGSFLLPTYLFICLLVFSNFFSFFKHFLVRFHKFEYCSIYMSNLHPSQYIQRYMRLLPNYHLIWVLIL